MEPTPRAIGRANVALVHGSGADRIAVISSLTARVINSRVNPSLRFIGPGTATAAVSQHLHDTVLPLVNRILVMLGQSAKSFELSIVNIGAAASRDVGVQVTGYSADLPAFLAMLSAALQLPAPQDVLATGHIASPEGDIAFVEAIPAKIAAALADRDIGAFIHPSIDNDRSLEALSPVARQAATESLLSASYKIRTLAVDNISDAFQAVFDDTAIVLAALRSGFYSHPAPPEINGNPVSTVVRRLHACGEPQFWASLESLLLRGDDDAVKELLGARIALALDTGTYPSGIGRQLMDLLRSIPPATRESQLRFPLLPQATGIRLGQYASEADHLDFACLFDAVRGHLPVSSTPASSQHATAEASTTLILDTIVTQIDGQALTQAIRRPINDARASYRLTSSTVASAKELLETVAAYYIHLMRRYRPNGGDVPPEAAAANALDLLARAFAREGGWKAAVAEAVYGRKGGIRRVLDAITEQFCIDEEQKHVNRVFKEALDPFDHAAKAALIDALRSRLAPHLPPDVVSAPAARFAEGFEPIVAAYVQSLDRVAHLFQRM